MSRDYDDYRWYHYLFDALLVALGVTGLYALILIAAVIMGAI